MVSGMQNKVFINAVIDDDLLARAIKWIKNNMEPGDVFDRDTLDEWAFDRGYLKE